MSNGKTRASFISEVLSKVSDWLKLLALIVLCGEAVGIMFILNVEDDFAKTLAFIVMILLFFSVVIGIFTDRRYHLIDSPQKMEDSLFIGPRGKATPMMKEDIKKANRLVFLGISNSSLHEYLSEIVETAKVNKESLPFESIDIFFAREDNGETWEGKEFGGNMVKAIHDISYLFTHKSNISTVPSLKRVSFYQSSLVCYYGGSLFRLVQDDKLDKNLFSIIYVILYMPLPDADTKTSYTMRISAGSKDLQTNYLYNTYSNAYQYIKETSSLLCEFEIGNIWDGSADEWDNFEANYPIYSDSMESLFDFGDISPHHKVLDIGCGTGRALKNQVKSIEGVSLFLLDKSPQMIKKAEKMLSDYENVKFIVADAKKPLFGAFKNEKFDRIIIHFSFPSFIDNSHPIESFARNWKNYLKRDGELLIAIHNSFIECDTPSKFKNWSDPLREEIRITIESKKKELTPHLRQDSRRKFTIDEIKEGFEKEGFYLKDHLSKTYERTMRDRITMWKVPAVSSSFIDIKEIGVANCSSLLDEVLERVREKETMPTTVAFLKFSLCK